MSTLQQSTQRNHDIDITKGLAIIAVICSHSCGFPFQTEIFFVTSYIAVFFFVSGYIYKNRPEKMQTKLLKRAKVLLVPYFIYNFILLAITASYIRIKQTGFSIYWVALSLKGFLYSSYSLYWPGETFDDILLFPTTNGPLWFLTCMMVASVLFFFVLRYTTKYWLVIVAFLACSMAIAFLPIRLPWSADVAMVAASFMLVGFWMAQKGYFKRISRWYYKLMVLLCYLFLCVFNGGGNISTRIYGDYGRLSVLLFFITGVLGSWCYIWLAEIVGKTPLKTAIAYVGKHTIPVLGFHLIVFLVWEEAMALFALDMTNPAIYWTIGLAKVAISVVACLAGNVVYQRLAASWRTKYEQRKQA